MLSIKPARRCSLYCPVVEIFIASLVGGTGRALVAYIDCAIFKVTLTSGLVVRLVVPVSQGAMTLEIRHDGNGNFTFPIKGSVERIGVFQENSNSFYREYQFSKISGGSVLTRTINDYPQAITFSNDGGVVGTAQVGQTVTVDGADYTGGIGNVTQLYVLQKSDTGSGGWTTVTTSATEPYAHLISGALEGKYLRVSTQLTDDTGLKVRNSSATSAVLAEIP